MERKTKDEQAKDYIVNILIAMASVSVLILFIFTAQIIKIEQNHIFRTEYISDYQNGGLGTSIIINDGTTVQLQEFRINPSDSTDYDFCFKNTKSTSAALEISLVDENLNVLGKNYFSNTTSYDCIYTNQTLKRKQYLGVLCNNCDVTNTLTIQEELLGTDVKKVTLQGSSINVEIANTNGYVLRQNQNGKYLLKLLNGLYNTFLFMLLLGMLIMVGYDSLKDMLAGVEG